MNNLLKSIWGLTNTFSSFCGKREMACLCFYDFLTLQKMIISNKSVNTHTHTLARNLQIYFIYPSKFRINFYTGLVLFFINQILLI